MILKFLNLHLLILFIFIFIKFFFQIELNSSKIHAKNNDQHNSSSRRISFVQANNATKNEQNAFTNLEQFRLQRGYLSSNRADSYEQLDTEIKVIY